MDRKRMEFYTALGYRAPSAAVTAQTTSGVASADVSELPPLGPDDLGALRERFLREPEEVLSLIRQDLGAPVSEGALVHVLQELE
uniref:hypothetical protein n=2 Tax=Pseudomonadati TaxID=3379134 RepID=UPI001BC84A1F